MLQKSCQLLFLTRSWARVPIKQLKLLGKMSASVANVSWSTQNEEQSELNGADRNPRKEKGSSFLLLHKALFIFFSWTSQDGVSLISRDLKA